MKGPLAAVVARCDATIGQPDPLGAWADSLRSRALDRAEVQHDDGVLDLGCGDGRALEALGPHIQRGLGVEASARRAAEARSRGVEVCLGDLRQPPPLPGLRTVLMLFSLRLLDEADRRALFALLFARLPVDGQLLIADLLFSLPPEDIDGIEGWLDPDLDHALRVDGVEAELRAAGFTTWAERVHPALALIVARRPPAAPAARPPAR